MRDGAFAGVGHYQQGGSIRVRILSFDDCEITPAFWERRIKSAMELRRAIGLKDNPATDSYRLVHGEGDALPGLIVDFYAGHAVVQPHSAGMTAALPEIRAALKAVLGDDLGSVSDPSTGPGEPRVIRENNNLFKVDWTGGQKTGFYLDQRVNRALVQSLSADRSVLNVFSYTGAFAVYALKGGARHVISVESSRPANAMAAENTRLNGLDPASHDVVAADAFEFLKSPGENHDMVILDPPAFAKHLSARHAAIQAYRRINALAMQAVRRGGILFTFSCSQVVTADLFRGAVFAAALDAGREARILYRLQQPPDHPVSIHHPEGEYLKGLALLVT